MSKIASRKIITLAAGLAIGSAFVAGSALANGGGGIGGDFIDGAKLATGGNFSCSEPVGNSCPNDDAIHGRSNAQPMMIAHNRKGAEPYQYRY